MKPHEFIGERVEYEKETKSILRVEKGCENPYMFIQELDFRGFGMINISLSKEQAEEFEHNLGEWIAEAINEKIAREKLEKIENSDTAKKLIALSKQIDKEWFSKHQEVLSDRYRSKSGRDKPSIAKVIKGTIKYYAPKDDLV